MTAPFPAPPPGSARTGQFSRILPLRRLLSWAASASLLLPAHGSAHSEPGAKSPPAKPAESPVPAASRQLVLVRGANWNSTGGKLRRYERVGDGAWSAVGEPIAVNLGRHGMAWGRGLQAEPQIGMQKREGDGRSPAGVFDLATAFGYEAEPPEGARFPYVHLRESTVCVEELRSKDYNRIIDTPLANKNSWERRSAMLRPDGLFRLGIVVQQNAPDTRPGAGSCVFLHIWRGPHEPTSGCTAMAEEGVRETVRWLDPKLRPVLVQLPDLEYVKLRERWQLP